MKWSVYFLPLALLILGCSNNNKSLNPSQDKQIWPLKVGNEWTYEDRLLDSAGRTVHVDTSVFAVIKDTLIQGERWYVFTYNGVRDPEGSLGTIRSDGLWTNGPSEGLVFKYPAAVNDTFMMGTDTSIVESIHDTVTVPAGTFVCINYKWVGGSEPNRTHQYHYMSPGVGFIKAEEYYKTAGGYVYPKIRTVLISYTLR